MLDMRIPDTSMPHNAARRAQVCATIMLSGSISLPQLHATWCMNVGFGQQCLTIAVCILHPHSTTWSSRSTLAKVLCYRKGSEEKPCQANPWHFQRHIKKKWKGTFCQIIPQNKIWAKSRLGSASKPLRCISMEEHWIIWQRVIPSSSLQGNAAMQIQHWNLIAFLEISPTINSIVTGRARLYTVHTLHV